MPALSNLCFDRHIHVSLRDSSDRNVFAVSDSELSSGRADAAYEDTKFISSEAESFLAGVLDGIADSERNLSLFVAGSILS